VMMGTNAPFGKESGSPTLRWGCQGPSGKAAMPVADWQRLVRPPTRRSFGNALVGRIIHGGGLLKEWCKTAASLSNWASAEVADTNKPKSTNKRLGNISIEVRLCFIERRWLLSNTTMSRKQVRAFGASTGHGSCARQRQCQNSKWTNFWGANHPPDLVPTQQRRCMTLDFLINGKTFVT